MKDYPWLKHYEAGVPHTLQPYPDITVLDVLADTLKQRPEHPLAIFQGREVSHREVEEHSNALAAALDAERSEERGQSDVPFPQLPAELYYFLCHLEGGGHRGAAQSAVYAVRIGALHKRCRSTGGNHRLDLLSGSQVLPAAHEAALVIASDVETYAKLPMKREGDSIKLEKGNVWWSDLIDQYKGSPRPAVKVEHIGNRRHPVQRWYDRHSQGRHGQPPFDHHHCYGAHDMVSVSHCRMGG